MPNGDDSTASVNWTPRQVILTTLFVVGVLISLVLVYRFRTVGLMLFVALLIGTGLKPGVNFLAARGLSRLYGGILIYAVLLIAFLGFVFLALPPILEQSTSVTSLAQTYYHDARQVMVDSPSAIIRNLGSKLAPMLDGLNMAGSPAALPQTPQDDTSQNADAVSTAFKFAGMLAWAIFFFVAASLTAFYWTLESERVIRTFLLLVPTAKREGIRELINAIEGKLGAYLIGEGILMLAIGVMSLIAFLIIGLPNALVLAIIAAFMEAVPTIGPVLGAIPALLIAASTDPTKIIWVLAASVIIQLLENNLLVPRVMDRSVGVNPLLTILFMAALSSLIGLPGALLAVPIAAIFQLLINRYVINPVREPDLKPEGRDYLSYLRLQVQEVANDSRKQISAEKGKPDKDEGEEQMEETIESLANDLDQLLAQVTPAGDA